MDNQLFTGGPFLDDMPQVCTLCGLVFNNSLAHQHHMQLHMLANAQLMGSQPPPDPGIVIPTGSNILELMVSQHGMASVAGNPLLSLPGVAPTSLPHYLHNTGLATGGIVSLQQPAPLKPKPEKKSRSKAGKASAGISSTAAVTSATSTRAKMSSMSQMSQDTSMAGTYLSTFAMDLPKLETTPPKYSIAPIITQQSPSVASAGSFKDSFSSPSSHIDPLEALIFTSPVKTVSHSLDRSGSISDQVPLDMLGSKEKLFQPFMDNSRESHGLVNSFGGDSSFMSPVKSNVKTSESDALSTPQKIFHDSNDSLFTSVAHSSSSELRLFGGLNHEGITSHSSMDRKMEMSSQRSLPLHNETSSSMSNSQFFPGILDPLHISPKSTQLGRKPETSSSLDTAGTSPEAKPQGGLGTDFISSRVSSPKISPALPTGFLDSDIAALPTKAYTYVSEAALPKPYGSAQTSTAPGPAIDMAVNPLGTGYFNALTQKLINPSFSINNDFSKPGSSGGGSGAHGQKGKIYFENGALINNEYDKISDSNDDDDLDRILDLDTIDAKTDKIDSSKDFEIEELLNEFNEKQEDMKNNSGHLDDFLKDVIGEPSKAKAEAKPSKTEESFMPPEAIEFNQSAIAELLDAEMEKIDMETKEVEKSRLSAISSSGPSSSTTSDSVDDTTSSFPTLTTTATSTTPTSVVSTVSAASGSDAKPPDSEPKKDEDHVDFDIPKVGKLMKIRKYVEIQKQKEQTAVKQVAVKVHEKKEPPVEEKPQLQTIIVQVSKRKKIEYGPYINKQSLLEGKPKNMPAEASPPKPFRPKPKPQTPVRRTFNLRERRNKPDFATLAGTHPRNSDGKKSEEKSKDKTEKVDKDEKDIDSKDIVEVMEIVNETVEGEIDTANELSGKILTRNKEKEKMKDKSSDEKKKLVKVEDKSADIAKNNENETVVDNGKPKLRSRHVKTETENVETKNLRKRNIKVSPDSGIKHKVKKTDPDDAPEKETRSKGKQKGDKTEIKKCSVNLGEKLNTSEAKSKGKLDKSRVIKGRTENTILEQGKEETPKEVSVDIETNKDIDIETVDGKPDEDYKEIADESNTTAKQTELEEVVEEDNDNADDVNMKEKVRENIFEKVHVEKAAYRPTENTGTVVSISSSSDKKVTMKFKLGPDFHKSIREYMSSAPKKRKIEIVKETVVKETKSKDTVAKEAEVKETESKETVVKETESKDKSDDEENNQEKLNTVIAKTDNESEDPTMSERKKDSVENEFQRLVNEAMEEVKKAKKEGDSGKQERYVNLRKRLNETVRYNLDDSEDELDKQPLSFVSEAGTPKAQKVRQGKGIAKTPKSGIKTANQGVVTPDTAKKELKKDVDVYDFTDTEMSDHEDPSGFKPKYVSNIQKSPIGAKKLPFVSTPLSQNQTDEQQVSEELPKDECEDVQNVNDDKGESATYDIAKTVEPLKIKLSKIKPFKEKRHKHKKKKKKKDRDRKDCVREDYKSDLGENSEGSNIVPENSDNSDIKPVKLDNVKSVESVGMESVSNDGDDENGTSDKQNKKPSKLKEKKHICEFCNLGFSQKCDLRRHVMIHTGERPWPCEICDKKFQRKTDLVKHVRTHTGEKPYACEFCDKRVSDKSQLIVHMRLHTGDRPYRCENCGKRCITSSELSRHGAAHCAVKTLSCSDCKKVFKKEECLGMHMKLHYLSRSRPYKCDKCALGFDTKVLLDIHKCIDPSKNIYICSECYEEFIDETLYAEHIKTHDLGVIACNVCTLIFSDKHSLETHLCTLGVDRGSSDSDKTPPNREDDKPVQVLCEICDLEFNDQDQLSLHLPSHDNDKGSFMCDLCSEIFTVRKRLKQHSSVHERGQQEAIVGSGVNKEQSTVLENSQKRNLRDKRPSVRVGFGDNSSDTNVLETSTGQKTLAAMLESGMSKTVNTGFMSTQIKTETLSPHSQPSLDTAFGNRIRASVISGMFNVNDENSPERSNPTLLKQEQLKTAVSSKNSNNFSPSIITSDRFFDTSEFTSSPDFSSLTEDDNLELDPFSTSSKMGPFFEGKSQESRNIPKTNERKDAFRVKQGAMTGTSFSALKAKSSVKPVTSLSTISLSDYLVSGQDSTSIPTNVSLSTGNVPHVFRTGLQSDVSGSKAQPGLKSNTAWQGTFQMQDFLGSLLPRDSKSGGVKPLNERDSSGSSRNNSSSNQSANFFPSKSSSQTLRTDTSQSLSHSELLSQTAGLPSGSQLKGPLLGKGDLSHFAQSYLGRHGPQAGYSTSMAKSSNQRSAAKSSVSPIVSGFAGTIDHSDHPGFLFSSQEGLKDKDDPNALLSNFDM